MERNDRLLLECTPTYRKHYSSGFGRKLFNDELGHENDWFYFAYPDVAKWFESNYDEIAVTLKRQGVRFSIYDHDYLQVFRYVVTMYKQKFGRLELAV